MYVHMYISVLYICIYVHTYNAHIKIIDLIPEISYSSCASER